MECSIQAWTESVISQNCQLGSLADCVIPVTQELVNRKTAFIHLYHSANRESLMRYLSEISQHMVQCYIDNATKSVAVPEENRETLAWVYKCALVGVIMDWLDKEASYDLPVFCERVLNLFAGSENRAFLMYTEEAL